MYCGRHDGQHVVQAHHRLPVVVAIGLVVVNLVFQFLPDWTVVGWLARTNLLLHIAVVLGLLGVLLGDAL